MNTEFRTKKSDHPSFQFPIFSSILTGLLLTGSFPKIGMAWLAWFALVPLLICLRNLSAAESFRAGFLAGLVHYLTLAYWLAYTMKTYGHLPLYLCVPILLLLSAYLALYVAIFSMSLTKVCSKPGMCGFLIPFLWVSLEYVRSFLLSGFPWELMGYSQFEHLNIIQISDVCGVYGVSFLIALCNGVIFLGYLCLTKKDWQGTAISRCVAAGAMAVFAVVFIFVWSYGKSRVGSVDEDMAASPSLKIAIVQGNIDQAKKWDAAFRYGTTKKYVDLSLSAKDQSPDLVVWPETATPFYLLHNAQMTGMVLDGVQEIGTHFLIGSPSFIREGKEVAYHNSAYLINPDRAVSGIYHKVHLVPFGEYVPLKRWLPFLGKMVAHVGDFRPGEKGNTLLLGEDRLGIQICYEIIFPPLSGAMVANGAGLLINITNDAWYGSTSAPYQHFSMTVFRAVENKRSLIRAANTGISGFVDPVGRVMASTALFEDAVLTREVPVLSKKTLYTRFGDVFAMICMGMTILVLVTQIKGNSPKS